MLLCIVSETGSHCTTVSLLQLRKNALAALSTIVSHNPEWDRKPYPYLFINGHGIPVEYSSRDGSTVVHQIPPSHRGSAWDYDAVKRGAYWLSRSFHEVNFGPGQILDGTTGNLLGYLRVVAMYPIHADQWAAKHFQVNVESRAEYYKYDGGQTFGFAYR